MRVSLRTLSFAAALLLFPLLVLGTEVGSLDTPEPQQRPPMMTTDDIQEYGSELITLLASPCDQLSAPASFNELHDCQRVINPIAPDTLFGALLGIFPAPAAMDLPVNDFLQPTLVGFITNAGGDGDYEDLGYSALHISEKTSTGSEPAQFCLWLELQDSTDLQNGWRAAVKVNDDISFVQDFVGCTEEPQADEWNLRVKRRVKVGMPVQYPPTARWAWTEPGDILAGEHHIEVQCGDGSCAITDAVGALANDLPPGLEKKTVPGWFDAQFLGIPRIQGGDTILVPGPWGAVYPIMLHGSLGSVVGTWHIAAEMQFEGDPGPYVDKFLLNPAGFSRLWINTSNPSNPRARFDNNFDWEEVDVQTGQDGHGPHGSTRWRWHPTDEGPWMPCDNFGCCEPIGLL